MDADDDSTAEEQRERLQSTAAHLKQQSVAQCPVCMDVLEEPARLQCRHSFCRGCIDTVMATASVTAVRPRCPVCNVEFRRREVRNPRPIRTILTYSA